jgi:hypothetical protein
LVLKELGLVENSSSLADAGLEEAVSCSSGWRGVLGWQKKRHMGYKGSWAGAERAGEVGREWMMSHKVCEQAPHNLQ